MSRPTIFGDKSTGTRKQGVITAKGETAFQAARKRLAKLVGWPESRVSDGDVIEFMARGEAATRKWLDKHPVVSK